jgi:hypothetical protein
MTREEALAEIAAAITDERRADLRGANLTRAYLTYADLAYADLTGAKLTGAKLTGANLTGANLTNAYLAGAKLTGAKLTGANLTGANLTNAYLTGAYLTGANLTDAYLGRANLTYADLAYADLTGAKLTGAKLTGAYLTGANLAGANLTGATGLDELSGEPDAWPAGFTPPVIEATPARVYGKHTAAVLKLRKPETPRAARDFKRMYPTEFESLKSVTQGRDFTPETVERLRYAYESPVEWLLTTGRYESDAQRLCAEPNAVLKFNVRIDAEQYTEEQRDILSKLRETSKRSGHPVEKKPFFTIGWVRYCVDDAAKTWLIEEVQSDVQGVRKGLKDPAARRQLEDGGLPPERVDEAVALLHPYMEHFYEDALGVVFDLAQQKGYSVEMLEYEDKRSMGSPRQIYTDLPKSMGMRLGPGSTVLSGVQRTWKITPNKRRKTSRRAAPRAAQRKTSRRRS